jgi:ABC-type sugar transport system ATPase subunit
MIQLCDVAVTAGDFSLSAISFHVDAGQYAVLMGQTGRGKTTILESICGLRKIKSGRILVHGCDVTNASPGDRGVCSSGF